MTTDRLQHLEDCLSLLGEQLNSMEKELILAPTEEKARIGQKIREELKPKIENFKKERDLIQAEIQQNSSKEKPQKSLNNQAKEQLIGRVETLKISQGKIFKVRNALNKVPSVARMIAQRNKNMDDYIDSQLKEAQESMPSGNYKEYYRNRMILEDIILSFSRKLSVEEEFINQIAKHEDIEKIRDRADLTTIEQKVDLLKKKLCCYEEIRHQFEPPTLEEKICLLSKEISIEKKKIDLFLDAIPVDKQVFIKISQTLRLKLIDIVDFTFIETLTELIPQIKSFQYGMIKTKCGNLRILDVPSPVELTDFFVDVNILSEPLRYRRLTVSEFPTIYDSERNNFDRWALGITNTDRVTGLQAVRQHSKLIILGKPGSGKTSFLKHIAMQCIKENFMQDYIPIFVELKSFSETLNNQSQSNLYEYILSQFQNSKDSNKKDITRIFEHGRGLILLDGLDEVSEKYSFQVEEIIIKFCEKFYNNHVVITCRTAAIGDEFKNFTYVEIADFDDYQIQKFARNWFTTVEKNSYEEAKEKSKVFFDTLSQEKNEQIKEIAVTPILLSLTCLVFQSQSKLPSKRSKLYEDALDILLRKWDKTKRLDRDYSYRNLSVSQKIDLLSYIATITFEKERFFFEKHEIINHITNYFEKSSNLNQLKDENAAEDILKSIEVQHGLLIERARNVYSFCQLTFQEYFTAKSVIKGFSSSDSGNLFEKVANRSWREIFLLSIELVSDPEEMLLGIKKSVDEIISQNSKICGFINWIQNKSNTYKYLYKPEALRAFYLIIGSQELKIKSSLEAFSGSSLATCLDHRLKRIFQIGLCKNHVIDNMDFSEHEKNLAIELTLSRILFYALNFDVQMLNEINKLSSLYQEPEKSNSLIKLSQELRKSLGSNIVNMSKKQWKEQILKRFLPKFREDMIAKHNIGHDWKFNNIESRLLKKYYSSVLLLFNCLSIEDRVDSSLRDSIIRDLIK